MARTLSLTRPIAKAAGLPDTLRVHDLRHAATCLLLSHGTPIPLVAELLGHTDPSITLRVYSHATPTSQRQVADTFERMFGTSEIGAA